MVGQALRALLITPILFLASIVVFAYGIIVRPAVDFAKSWREEEGIEIPLFKGAILLFWYGLIGWLIFLVFEH